MQNTEWHKIKEVFNQVCDLPIGEREALLSVYDELVQKEVRDLLDSDEHAKDFIEESAAVELGVAHDVNIGQQIDDYKIVALIGEGGMGNVYLAERVGFEQKVALKLIKRGMDTRAVLKRFKTERQILSRLNHPNIAKLLDGGETPDGLPYFVMEYIEGLPITKFCEEHRFDVNERLELFQKVCEAITYAHTNLIVHRDIKPSNIIVTNDGTPKLLDFGIAKLLDNETENTATIGRMFTPEYASPEQINGQPIATTADVYSLGVVLYELLSGVRPFNSKSKSYGEIANLILTEEPVRPSSVASGQWSEKSGQWAEGGEQKRTSENKAETQNDFTNLKSKIHNPKSLRGDLDNIILKSLRKEPESRYQSVKDFSDDISRHLKGLPVTATADSTRYRLSKFVQRNNRSVVISAFISLLILSLTGLAIYQGIVATRERDRAERRLVETRKIASSLMFEIHDSLQDVPGATAARELLVKRASESLDIIHHGSGDNPDLLAEVAVSYRKVGDIMGHPGYSSLAKLGDALPYYQKAFDIQKKLLESDPKNADLILEFGNTNYVIALFYYQARGETDEALKYCRTAQENFEILALREPNNAEWKHQLAKFYAKSSEILRSMNKVPESNKDIEIAIENNDEAIRLSPEDTDILNTSANLQLNFADRLGNPYFNDEGKPDESLLLLEKVIEKRQKLLNKEPNNFRFLRSYGSSLQSLGDVYAAKGDFRKAIESFRRSSAIFEELAFEDNKDEQIRGFVALNAIGFANALRANGNPNEALPLLKKSIEYFEGLHIKNPENTGMAISLSLSLEAMADLFVSENQTQQALKFYLRSIDTMTPRKEKNDSYEIIIPLARFYFKAGKIKATNQNQCSSAFSFYQQAYHNLESFRLNNSLSPTNTALYNQVKSHLEKSNCKF